MATGTVVASPSTRAPTGRVAAGVAGALHISPDKTANSAFTVRLAVTFSGTYDCNQHVSSKAQHKHTVLISFTGITEEEAVAALSSLHRRENASVPFTGVSAIAMLPDIPISEGKSPRASLRTTQVSGQHKTSASAVPHTTTGRARKAQAVWLIFHRWSAGARPSALSPVCSLPSVNSQRE